MPSRLRHRIDGIRFDATRAIRHYDVIRELAAAAGFTSCEVLPVDGGFFRLYRLS